ncbi:MAG: TetR/AcrR family transcriptional regulator [Aeromicrobium sp.]
MVAQAEGQPRARRKALSAQGADEPVGTRTDRELRLIEVAADMFHRRGYDATTLQGIADELGLLKGSVYHYIDSKDDLLWVVILREHNSMMSLVAECRAAEGTARDRLTMLVRGYSRSLREDRLFVSVYLRDVNRLSPERRERIVTERDGYLTFVAELLEEGRATGVFRPDLDPTIASQGLVGMLNSMYRWYRPEGDTPPEEIVEEILRLIVDGVAA